MLHARLLSIIIHYNVVNTDESNSYEIRYTFMWVETVIIIKFLVGYFDEIREIKID